MKNVRGIFWRVRQHIVARGPMLSFTNYNALANDVYICRIEHTHPNEHELTSRVQPIADRYAAEETDRRQLKHPNAGADSATPHPRGSISSTSDLQQGYVYTTFFACTMVTMLHKIYCVAVETEGN
jgi:hypothetical protein